MRAPIHATATAEDELATQAISNLTVEYIILSQIEKLHQVYLG